MSANTPWRADKVVWRRMDRRINAAVVEAIDDPLLGRRPVVPQETCVLAACESADEAHYSAPCSTARRSANWSPRTASAAARVLGHRACWIISAFAVLTPATRGTRRWPSAVAGAPARSGIVGPIGGGGGDRPLRARGVGGRPLCPAAPPQKQQRPDCRNCRAKKRKGSGFGHRLHGHGDVPTNRHIPCWPCRACDGAFQGLGA